MHRPHTILICIRCIFLLCKNIKVSFMVGSLLTVEGIKYDLSLASYFWEIKKGGVSFAVLVKACLNHNAFAFENINYKEFV